MYKLLLLLVCGCLLVSCKQKVLLPPDNELSFQLETPDEGSVQITSNSVGDIHFANHIRPEVIAEAPMMKLHMDVIYSDLVTESDKPARFSLQIGMYDEDPALFSPVGDGSLYFYTNPQDLIARFLAPVAPEEIRRFMTASIDYDSFFMYGANTEYESPIQIESAELVESPDGEEQVVVSGRFELPIAGWYQYPATGQFATKDGQFRFTINLAEIY